MAQNLGRLTPARHQSTPSSQRLFVCEHVWGTLRHWGHDEFLCRGLERVRAEFTLSALAWNLRRALNVAGMVALVAALLPAA